MLSLSDLISDAAADRIEELEAKLAALTSAATKVHDSYWNSTDGVITGMYDLERALGLAELKGEDRGWVTQIFNTLLFGLGKPPKTYRSKYRHTMLLGGRH
jgi:hypothetical protein